MVETIYIRHVVIIRNRINDKSKFLQVRASTSVGAGVYSFPVSPSVQRVGNSSKSVSYNNHSFL